MTAPVATAARIVAELRERLKAEYGLTEGDDALEDILEGATELPEMLAMMARDAVQAEAYAEATKGRIKLMTERKANLERRSDKLRAAIAWALSEAGWKKIPRDALPEMGAVTVSPGRSKAVVDNEDDLPAMFYRFRTIRLINMEDLGDWLREGNRCPGAHLSNPQPTLTIRSK